MQWFIEQISLRQSSKGKRRHSRKDPESEESDSDPDQLTSSRTESSNQLDAKLKHSELYTVPCYRPVELTRNPRPGTVPSTGIIYHGGQSSTSSDLSPPMSVDQQKSLPRRGRSRYHLHHITNTNTTPRHKTKNTLNSPLSSPRNNCSSISNQSQVVVNSNQYSMPSSQFRPIHTTRTINLTKAIPKLSPNC